MFLNQTSPNDSGVATRVLESPKPQRLVIPTACPAGGAQRSNCGVKVMRTRICEHFGAQVNVNRWRFVGCSTLLTIGPSHFGAWLDVRRWMLERWPTGGSGAAASWSLVLQAGHVGTLDFESFRGAPTAPDTRRSVSFSVSFIVFHFLDSVGSASDYPIISLQLYR